MLSFLFAPRCHISEDAHNNGGKETKFKNRAIWCVVHPFPGASILQLVCDGFFF